MLFPYTYCQYIISARFSQERFGGISRKRGGQRPKPVSVYAQRFQQGLGVDPGEEVVGVVDVVAGHVPVGLAL